MCFPSLRRIIFINLFYRTTLQSTVYITFTDSAGETITSAPPEITRLSTSTQSNGGVVTVTHIGVNPTLSPNNDSGDGSSCVPICFTFSTVLTAI